MLLRVYGVGSGVFRENAFSVVSGLNHGTATAKRVTIKPGTNLGPTVVRISITENDVEALIHLLEYAESAVSDEDRRSIYRFQNEIIRETGSIDDFRFLLNNDEQAGREERRLTVSRGLVQGLRKAVDRIVESSECAAVTENERSGESGLPEWLDRLHNRVHAWDPTHQADINAGLARYN